MRRSPRTAFYMLIAIAALLLGTMHPVQAEFKVRLTEDINGPSTTIKDGDFGKDFSSLPGSIMFMGQVGDFTVNFTIASSKPMVGSATSPELSVVSFNVSSNTTKMSSLTIELSDTDFGPPSGWSALTTSINGTLVPGTIAAATYFANGNVDFANNLVSSVGPVGPGSSAGGTDTQGFSPESLFSLNLVTTITNPIGYQVAQFDASSKVPEASATLCLGMALFGLTGYSWWDRKKRQRSDTRLKE